MDNEFYISQYHKAEHTKSEAYAKYYTSSNLDEKANALRTVMRCHYIKECYARLNHGGSIRRYNLFKIEWLTSNNNRRLLKPVKGMI